MDVVSAARDLYGDTPVGARVLQSLRPYICPFEELVARVPIGSTVLDVGCGAGLFLGLLGRSGRVVSGIGFDASSSAIATARAMARRHLTETRIVFEDRDVDEPWPEGPFDLVTMVDVLHHISPNEQRPVILKALEHVRPGGSFLYKDMVEKPRWRAAWNRLHDLILARQWIHYRSIVDVADWILSAGWAIEDHVVRNRLMYGHEILMCRKPA